MIIYYFISDKLEKLSCFTFPSSNLLKVDRKLFIMKHEYSKNLFLLIILKTFSNKFIFPLNINDIFRSHQVPLSERWNISDQFLFVFILIIIFTLYYMNICKGNR